MNASLFVEVVGLYVFYRYSFRHKHHLKRHLEGTHNIPYIRGRSRGTSDNIKTCDITEPATDKLKQTALVTDRWELVRC